MKENEYSIQTSDNLTLRGKKYEINNPKALVLILHGLGEHQGRYEHVAEALNKAGFLCYTYDARGHGISDGKRGHIPAYEQLLDDQDKVVDYMTGETGDLPLFVYGHSMGGNIVANYMLRRKRKEVKGAIISSPWLKLKMKLQFIELILGKILFTIWPGFVRNSNLNPHFFSHDKEVVKQYIEDPKVHGKVTLQLFYGHKKAGLWALEHANEIDKPMLVMQSAADEIVSPEASREFAEKSGATFKSWECMYHEPHNELEKDKVLAFVVNWLEEQMAK